jgi:hypothetical protein
MFLMLDKASIIDKVRIHEIDMTNRNEKFVFLVSTFFVSCLILVCAAKINPKII